MRDFAPKPPDSTGDIIRDTDTKYVGRIEVATYQWVTVGVTQIEGPHSAPVVQVVHSIPGGGARGTALLPLSAKGAKELADITEALGNQKFASLLREAAVVIEDGETQADHAARIVGIRARLAAIDEQERVFADQWDALECLSPHAPIREPSVNDTGPAQA